MGEIAHSAESAIRMRAMLDEDVPALCVIEQVSFASPWTSEMLAGELDAPFGWSMVAVDSHDKVVGFLLGRRYPDMWHVLDLAVATDSRGQGVGRALVREFVAAAEVSGRPVLLEVREKNVTAVSLYEAEGFVPLSVRKRYYADTGEDALVMVREPRRERVRDKTVEQRLGGDTRHRVVLR